MGKILEEKDYFTDFSIKKDQEINSFKIRVSFP